MIFTRLSRITFLLVLALTVSAVAFASPVGSVRSGGSQVDWQIAIGGYDHIQMNIQTPDGEVFTHDFKPGETPTFKLKDSSFADGTYTYELRVIPVVSASVKKQLQAARDSDDPTLAARILSAAGISAEGLVQSGAFSVSGGSVVNPDLVESGNNGTRKITTDARPTTPVTNNTVIPPDLIVQGSACVGFDCTSTESFGFDTLRLKENNTRINFEDTSVGSFPSNDWEITANDSASGGQNKLAITDRTNSKVPFTVEGNSPTNSIYVDSTGRVGFRTSTPVLDIHVSTSNTPGLRLEQTNAGGFSAQTWDIAGNESNFFIRDVTGGSRLPFRIRPGAPTSSIDINASGNVGIGTASPSERLHVFQNADTQTFVLAENSNTGTSANATLRAKSDTATVNFQAHSSTRVISRFGVTLGGWGELLGTTGNGLILGTSSTTPLILGTNSVERLHFNFADNNVGISCNAPTSDLVIASGSGCANPSSSINAGSTQFTAASSRTFKEHIEPVSAPDILEKIKGIGVYNYDFINGPKNRMGLIAEDFHQVFKRGDEKYIDGTEVQVALWLAVQQLTERNQELTDRLASLEKELKSSKQ